MRKDNPRQLLRDGRRGGKRSVSPRSKDEGTKSSKTTKSKNNRTVHSGSDKETQCKVGALVREYREKMVLTQQEFAKIVGRSRGWVSRVENGNRRVPIPMLHIVAEALNHNYEDFARAAGILEPSMETKIRDVREELESVYSKRTASKETCSTLEVENLEARTASAVESFGGPLNPTFLFLLVALVSDLKLALSAPKAEAKSDNRLSFCLERVEVILQSIFANFIKYHEAELQLTREMKATLDSSIESRHLVAK